METIKKKVSHTPGPWTCEETPNGQEYTTIVYGGFPLATVRGTDDMSCIDEEDEPQIAQECIANALVIKEAPVMLSYIKELISAVENNKADYSLLEKGRKIVFNAEN